MRFFVHVVRGNSLEKEVLQGMVLGKRSQGRQKTRWVDGTTTLKGMRITKATRLAENRKEWRELVQHVTAARQLPTTDGAN